MKLSYICYIFIIFLSLTLPNTNSCFAEHNIIFARVMTDDCCLYVDTEINNPIFTLTKTYFVELLYSSDDYYYARYDDVYGFVLKEKVKPVISTPNNPFLSNISFRIFVPSGANLRSSPKNDGANNLICTIPFLDYNILYYGTTQGEEAISKKGNSWYYCKYYYNNNSYVGYVYSPLCDCLTQIEPNNEEMEYMQEEPDFSYSSTETQSNQILEISQTAQTLIIIAISLPCLLFIYLLFKPTMIAETSDSKTTKQRKKQKISRLKKSDYFEFNDDDLN